MIILILCFHMLPLKMYVDSFRESYFNMAEAELEIDFSKYILDEIQGAVAEIISFSSQSVASVNVGSSGVV